MVITRSLTHGGAERTAANFIVEFSKYEDVTVVVLNGDRATYSIGDIPMINLNIPIHDKGNKFLWYYHLLKKINRLKKEYNINCTISFLLEPDIANVLSFTKDRKIISIRNKQSQLFKGLLRKIRDKIIFYKADKIVAISKMVKEDLIQNYQVNPKKIKVIYNFNNKDLIQKKMNEELSESDLVGIDFDKDLVAINVGRLTHQKGQWHLIRSFKKVVEQIPNAKLIILGEGKLKDYLQQLINDLNLQKHVFLLGYKANPYKYIKNSHVFVFSSLFEGLGNSIVESLVCNTPVISTDCDSGPREILAPDSDVMETGKAKDVQKCKFGILTPCFDENYYLSSDKLTDSEIKFAKAITCMFQDKKTYDYYKNRTELSIQDFSSTNIIQEWISVIESE